MIYLNGWIETKLNPFQLHDRGCGTQKANHMDGTTETGKTPIHHPVLTITSLTELLYFTVTFLATNAVQTILVFTYLLGYLRIIFNVLMS